MFWLRLNEKPVNMMRGAPFVMPFALCQWFDQLARLVWAIPNAVFPALTSFTIRLFSTCVICPRISSLYSSVVLVDVGWVVAEGRPNGSDSRPPDTLNITRVCGES